MSTICWTVIHNGSASVARHGSHAVHTGRHVARPIIHHMGQLPYHAARTAARKLTWVELVCRVIPAVVGGGGLLSPHPANPLLAPEPAPAIQQPGPLISALPAPTWTFVLPIPAMPTYPGGTTGGAQAGTTGGAQAGTGGSGQAGIVGGGQAGTVEAPEPSSAWLLFSGLAGILLARLAYSAGGAEPAASQTNLLRRGPVA